MRSPLGFKPDICVEGAEKTCREWGKNAFEELQEEDADRVPLREELVASGIRELGDEAFGAEFRQIIAERGERVAFGGAAERCDDGGTDFGGGECIAGCDVREAYKRMH